MARIGILKNDTVIWQDDAGNYCGGTVYEVDAGHALIETTHGDSIERPERDLFLLTTTGEMTEQLELTESLEESVRVANCRIRDLESELAVVRRQLQAKSPFAYNELVEWGDEEWPYRGEYRGSTPDNLTALVWHPNAYNIKSVPMSDLRPIAAAE